MKALEGSYIFAEERDSQKYIPEAGEICELSESGSPYEEVKIWYLGNKYCITTLVDSGEEKHYETCNLKFRKVKSEKELALDDMLKVMEGVFQIESQLHVEAVCEVLAKAGFKR